MRLALAICLMPLAAVAQDDPAGDFCYAAETGREERKQCIEDFEHAAFRILEYGKATGHIDEDGEVDFGSMMSSFFSWRTLVGLPPDDVFLICSNRAAHFAGEPDLRQIWACIRERDPEAARMDAI